MDKSQGHIWRDFVKTVPVNIIIEIYESGQYVKDICRTFHCNHETITKILKDNGIKIRNCREGKTFEQMYGTEKAKQLKKQISKCRIGQVPWCKGLTKKTSEKIRKAVEKGRLKQIKDYKEGRRIHPMLNKKHTLEALRKIKKARKNQIMEPMTDTTKKKIGTANRAYWNNLSQEEKKEHIEKTLKASMKRPSSYESKLCDLCLKNNLPFTYTGDGTFIIGTMNPDFTNHKDKILIEVYNDYFKIKNYGSIQNFKEQRGAYFKKHGYKTVFIGKEIIESPDWQELCLKKINEGFAST